ncbi:hypothetical protein LCGC14_3103770, partial [marine sediment metagenome]
VLTMGVQETIDDMDAEPGNVVVAGSLRRDEGGLERFLASLAEVFVRGVDVNWASLFKGSAAQQVKLPTYAFQRERYWLEASMGAGDATSIGQSSADHPLLGAAVGLADDQGWLFTGRLSLQTHPWLADHAVMDTVLLPGTAFVELATRAAGQVGCGRIEELILEAPLLIPDKGGVQVQVSVESPDESGRWPISIYSRLEQASDDGLWEEETWTRHATGVLTQGTTAESFDAQVWPPKGADTIDIDGLYDGLAEKGFDYGPAFQGLKLAWRRGDEVFAEVCLDQAQEGDAGSFGLHPALLDAALHTMALSAEEDQGARLPFSWNGVSLYATGASYLRVRLAPAGQ